MKVLPANWKRFAKAEVQQLFAQHLKPKTANYLAMTKDQLVAELEIYVGSMKEEMQETQTFVDPNVPQCARCNLPMVTRVNRATGEEFWGCQVFPMCKFTMSLLYNGQPAAQVQRQKMEVSKSIKNQQNAVALGAVQSSRQSKGYKEAFIESSEEMDGEMVKRALRTPLPSDMGESWDQISQTSSVTSPTSPVAAKVEVSEEELKLLKELRRAKK